MGWLRSARGRLAVGILIAVSATMVVAQSDGGALAGTIVDASGAVVPNATITVTGTQTGTVYNVTSNSTGGYRIPDMKVGAYNVKVNATGFKASESTGVVIQVNTVSSLNITMQVGSTQDTVTIVADAPGLQTESADIGT